MILYLDTETFCEVPIRHGTGRYAEDAEIMLATYAEDDGEVHAVEFPARGDLEELIDAADEVVIHNSFFDRTVLRHALGIEIPTSKIFDTMACALSHSLPGSLDKLCAILKVPEADAKLKTGRELIQLFCQPRPKNQKLRRATKHTHPEDWEAFVHYAKADIRSMRHLHKTLPRWNYAIGKPEHALWQLDQKANDRGIAVDLHLAQAAIAAVGEEREELRERTVELTNGDVTSTTRRDQLLGHLLEAYGLALASLRKADLERLIEDEELPEVVRELLRIRLAASSTGVTKYQALVKGVSSDGRLRGTLQYCGAMRTGRWAGRLFQPQNLARPDVVRIGKIMGCTPGEAEDRIGEYNEDCAFLLKEGGLGLITDDVIGVCQDLVRGVLVASPGKRLVVADLANIEGRVLAWLAGEDWKLDAFRDYDAGTGPDLYKLAYARSFNMDPKDVSKPQRQIGKVQELALGFQGAVGAFVSMALIYGIELPDEEALRIVKAWRKAHPATTSLWYATEDAAIKATEAPGLTTYAGKLAFNRTGAWLRMRLPSDRVLCYPSPRVDWVVTPCRECDGDGLVLGEDGESPVRCVVCGGSGRGKAKRQLTYNGVNQYTRRWERIKTYGGKLVENGTQATARDVIAAGLMAADRAGFDILLSVHDETIAEHETLTVEDLMACMTTQIGWTAGLPLAADGFETQRYRK